MSLFSSQNPDKYSLVECIRPYQCYRCPAISVLSSETKARVTVILDLDLEVFLSVRAPNSSQAFGGLSGGDMLALTLGSHIRFADVEEYLSLPQAINLHPDHVYSSTVMVHVRKSILQVQFVNLSTLEFQLPEAF